MSEFRILPPTRRAFTSAPSSHIIGSDSVRESTEVSRTEESIHGVQQHDPSRPLVHVIHGAYREGTYIVTSPSQPQLVQQRVAARRTAEATAAAAQPAWMTQADADEELDLAPQPVHVAAKR